jgi:protein-disulfide isomerase
MTTSKRSQMKKRRQQARQRERRTIILVVTGAVLFLVAIIVSASVIQQNQPIGEIVTIVPLERPNPVGTAMGDPNAPVRIDVFVDFQCPACQFFSQNVEKEVMENLVATGQVYYVYRHYPFLDDRFATKESDQAANASMCASDQGRFWDYHDMLFANWDGENEGSFADRRLLAFAEALDLDMSSFESCFQDNEFKTQIDQDYNEGTRMGVTGTPSVFVNGQLVTPGYVPTYEAIRMTVESALAASGN